MPTATTRRGCGAGFDGVHSGHEVAFEADQVFTTKSEHTKSYQHGIAAPNSCATILGLLNVWSASLCFVDAAYVNVGGKQGIPNPGHCVEPSRNRAGQQQSAATVRRKCSFALSIPARIADDDARDVRVQKIL
jgi:hypothetical protein